jgi:hypothetical protein
MIQAFVLCHEGELPYVLHDLRDVLQSHPGVQVVSQGSTEKMYMGYLLLESAEDLPSELFRELRANPDVYLYAVHDPDALEEDEMGEQAEEAFQEEQPAAPQS